MLLSVFVDYARIGASGDFVGSTSGGVDGNGDGDGGSGGAVLVRVVSSGSGGGGNIGGEESIIWLYMTKTLKFDNL